MKRKPKHDVISVKPSFPEDSCDNREIREAVHTIRSSTDPEPKQSIIPIVDDSGKKKVISGIFL